MIDYNFEPAPVNLSVRRGTVFSKRWTLADDGTGDPIDLSGVSIAAQVRKRADDTDVLLDLTEFVTGDEEGVIQIFVPANVTEQLDWSGVAVWDMELDFGDGPVCLMAGTVSLSRDVTRDD